MAEAIKILTLLDIVFVTLLALSGSVGGTLGLVYSCAIYIIPVLIGYYASLRLKAKREAEAGVAEEYRNLFAIDTARMRKLLPLVAPSVAIVFSISLITSILLSIFGASTPAVEDKGLFVMLLDHALTPAIFEEIVFRYLPLILIAPYSKRVAVFYSAFCFALIHCSLLQMPYAFVAGVVFMAIDLALGSIWPSVILHFINNAASVIWIKYCTTLTASLIFVGVMLALLTISGYIIYRKRRGYSEMLRVATEKGQSAEYGYPALILVTLCGYIAISNLFV